MLLKEGRPNLEPTVNDLVQLLSSVEIELCGADAEYVIKQVQCVGLEQALMEGLARLPRGTTYGKCYETPDIIAARERMSIAGGVDLKHVMRGMLLFNKRLLETHPCLKLENKELSSEGKKLEELSKARFCVFVEKILTPFSIARPGNMPIQHFVPPVDVDWMWRAAIMKNEGYRKIQGSFHNHWQTLKVFNLEDNIAKSKEEWERHTGLPYLASVADPIPPTSDCRVKKLVQSASMDILFWDQLKYYLMTQGIPADKIKDDTWVDDSRLLDSLVLAYKNQLLVVKKHPCNGIYDDIYRQGFSYGVDLVWHAHLLFPSAYEDDTRIITGRTVNHSSDESPSSFRHIDYLHQSIPEQYIVTFGKSIHSLAYKHSSEAQDPSRVLPPELMRHIFSLLARPFERTRSARVSRAWKQLANHNDSWTTTVYFQEFSSPQKITSKEEYKVRYRSELQKEVDAHEKRIAPEESEEEIYLCFSVFD